MEDPAQKAVRDYLKRDTKYHRGVQVIAVAAMVATIFVVACFTQPWPRLSPRGSYDTNLWGPCIALVGGFIAPLIVFRLMRRRTPVRPPPYDR